MARLFDTPYGELVIWLAVGAAVCAVGVYAISRVRRRGGEATISAGELLTNFREIHSQGVLSDEEYRTIKSMLAERLDQELKDTGEQG